MEAGKGADGAGCESEHLLGGSPGGPGRARRGGLAAGRRGSSHLGPSATRPEPAGRAARAAEGRRGRAEGRGRGRGLLLSRGVERGPEILAGSGRRCHRSSGHEDPVDGAVRVGTTVAWGPGWLRRGRALLPWSGLSLLRPRLEAGQGLRNVLLRSSLPSHRGLLLRLRPGVSRWVAGPGVGPPTVLPQTAGRGQGAGPLEAGVFWLLLVQSGLSLPIPRFPSPFHLTSPKHPS